MLMLIAALLAASPDTGPQRAVDLSWMEGRWVSCDPAIAEEVTETWIAVGEVLLGTSVTRHHGEADAWEQLRIVHSDSQTSYVAMPAGRAPVTFVLTDQTPEGAVFENPNHDWPQVIVYERDGDALMARIEGKIDGQARSMEWNFRSAPLNARCPA